MKRVAMSSDDAGNGITSARNMKMLHAARRCEYSVKRISAVYVEVRAVWQ